VIGSVLLTLVYASYRDVKYRDIPELAWLPSLAIVTAINLLLGRYDVIHTIISLIPPLAVLVLSLLDMIGGADFLALLLISLAHPSFYILPISLITLIYSLLIPIAVMGYYLILNILHWRELDKIKCVEGSRTPLIFLGRPLTVGRLLKSKFVYPLTIPSDKGYICRASFSLDDEEEDKVRGSIKDMVDRGIIEEEDVLWVTPGFPHVLFYLVGYVVALMTPQAWVVELFIRLLH
jgi:hypothetical protein